MEKEQTEEGQKEREEKKGRKTSSGPRKGGMIEFLPHPKNLLCAGLVLALSAAVLWWNRALLWELPEEGGAIFCGGFAAGYAALAILSAFLCLVKCRLPERIRQVLGWALLLLLPLGAYFAVDSINQTRFLDFSPIRGFANYLCYLMVFALIYGLCRRVWAAALIGGGAFLFFGIVNYFVIQFRGNPILPWDIQAMGTAFEVSGGYQYTFTRPMLLSVMGLLCAALLCLRLCPGKGKSFSKRFRLIERLCALGLSAVLFVLIFPMDILSSMGISVWAWNQRVSAQNTGVMAGFFANIQFLMVDKPEGYSEERLEELGESLGSLNEPEPLGQPEKKPTVIVVMNESMTDLQSVGDLELDTDCQPFLHSLQNSENVIWGTAYSSVYGGDTCNSEYEFLTGNTLAFLPSGCKPYQQYVDREQTALPSILKSQGYSCTAIHPGNKSAWQRDKAYPYLGFDEFIYARKFDISRELERDLTSDRSHYEQVLYEYEHRDPEDPQFLFTVTIQNHGGFEDKDYPATVHIESVGGKPAQGKYPQTEQYLSLVKESDSAFQDFLSYFEEQKDPVVVLFFGDHWPNLETGFLSGLLGTDASDPDFEALMKEHQVPFLIWANYPLEGQHIENISLNYLSGLLLRAAGLEGTAYTNYLESLRQQLPVINALGVMDREGSLYKNGEAPYEELLNEYASLQYNNAFEKEDKVMSIFTR